MADGRGPQNFLGADPMQAAAGGTTALRAIRGTPENAGLDARFKIGGIVRRHFGEEAIPRIFGWMDEGLSEALGH